MKKILIFSMLLLSVAAVAQRQEINIGTSANSGTGDPLRTAFTKTNANFSYLFDSLEVDIMLVITDTMALDEMETGYILAIPPALDGYNLVRVEAYAGMGAGTRAAAVNVNRLRAGNIVGMTSAGASFTENAMVNASNDDVQTGDVLNATSVLDAGSAEDAPYGIITHLYFKKP